MTKRRPANSAIQVVGFDVGWSRTMISPASRLFGRTCVCPCLHPQRTGLCCRKRRRLSNPNEARDFPWDGSTKNGCPWMFSPEKTDSRRRQVAESQLCHTRSSLCQQRLDARRLGHHLTELSTNWRVRMAYRAQALTMSLLCLLCMGKSAIAQEIAAEIDGTPQRRFSLMVSPIQLTFPMGEITAEYKVSDRLGIAAVLGYGRVGTTFLTDTGDDHTTAVEGGIQFRNYVIGNFDHGIQIGAQILYVHARGTDTYTTVSSAEGLAIGPFVGYKVTTDVGLTLETQVGYEYLALHTSESPDASSTIVRIANIHMGWSF